MYAFPTAGMNGHLGIGHTPPEQVDWGLPVPFSLSHCAAADSGLGCLDWFLQGGRLIAPAPAASAISIPAMIKFFIFSFRPFLEFYQFAILVTFGSILFIFFFKKIR